MCLSPSLKEYIKARSTILKAKIIISEKNAKGGLKLPPLGSRGLKSTGTNPNY